MRNKISKLLRKSMLLIEITLCACGIGSQGASNPNATTKEFLNPTGTLLTADIDDIVIAGVYNIDSIRYRDPEILFLDADFEHCKFIGDIESTIDWNCAFRNIDGCTARGRTILTDNSDFDFTQVEYEDFSIECNGAVKISEQKIDGQINTSRENSNVFCAHFNRSEDGFKNDSNACKNSAGETSVRFNNGTYVVGAYILDPLCTQLTTTIRDKEKKRSVTCDITQLSGACGSLAVIEAIDHCRVM